MSCFLNDPVILFFVGFLMAEWGILGLAFAFVIGIYIRNSL